MTRSWSLLALASLLFTSRGSAQIFGAPGGDLRVNTHTTESQGGGDMAFVDVLQDFVVVWAGTGPGDSQGIWAQPFAADLSSEGAPFMVNSYVALTQARPRVAGMAGDWVVVWRSISEDGSAYGVFARRFIELSPQGAAFRVNSVTTGNEYYGVPAVTGGERFVIVWQQQRASDPSKSDIWGRLFSTSGATIGIELQVNGSTTGYYGRPSIAGNNSGFVIVWEGAGGLSPAQYSIRGKRFTAAGAQVGTEFEVASSSTTNLQRPSIALAASGDFVVAWQTQTGSYDTSYQDVMARRFSASTGPVGAAFRVNTTTSGLQAYARVGKGGPDDRFMVVWHSSESNGANADVLARRFLTNGTPIGGEFRVNAYSTGAQTPDGLGVGAQGDVIVSWTSGDLLATQDGDKAGVYLRRFCFRLAGDANADEAITVSDILYLINNLFAGGPPPLRDSDANGDNVVTVLDVLYLINYLFAGGPSPTCGYE